jgi:hypothetical protein
MISCIQFATNLVRKFRQVFVKEIGLKSLTVSGEFFMGIRVMYDPFILYNCPLPT